MKFNSLGILALGFVLFCIPSRAQQQGEAVLFVHSEAANAPVFAAQEQRIRTALSSAFGERVEYFVEYIDHSRVEHPGYLDFLAEYLREKYASRRIDLQIAIGPEALPFIVKYRNRFSPGAPVVFSYPDVGFLNRTPLPANVTGLIPRLELKPTLDLILTLHPETKQVAIVLGPTSTRPNLANDLDSVRTQVAAFSNTLAFNFIGEGRIDDLTRQVAGLPPATPILYLFYVGDQAKTFISAVNAADIVTAAAKGPVYGINDAHMGHGIVGGWLNSGADYQTGVAELALHVLRGTIPHPAFETSTGKYIFDERQIKKWNIDPHRLPLGSKILFHQMTVWEQHKQWILGAAAVIVFQCLLIVDLLVQLKKRRLAEEGLLEKEAELVEAQRLSAVGSWQWDARTDEIAWSEELYRLVGCDPSLPPPSHGDRSSLFCAESWERLQREAEKALQTGTPFELDLEIVRPDNVTKWAVARGEAIRDSNELIIGLRGTLQDITERKRSEEALLESEKRERAKANELETVLDTAPVAIYIATDVECKQIMANRSGYELLNLQIGANTSMSAPEDERPKFRVLRDGVEIPAEELPIQRAAATGHSTFAAPLSVVFDDGTVRHVLCNAIPLFGPDGKPRGAVGATVDITDRKLAEDALASVSGRLIEAQEQERRRIARELHDDISQRLALMAIELQTLEKLSDDCPVQMHDLILHLYNRASGISTDVQSLSHELHSSKLEYLGIVTAMKSFCDEFAVQHEVKIDFDCSDVPGSLPENVSLCLFRVLQEGLRNAQKHSGERYFEVRLQSVSGVIQLTIRDSGTGFDSAEENMTNRGIGLISMRERVSLVNGTISILSRRMGGTEIIVRAPVSPSNGASPKKWAELGGRKGVCSDIAS